MLPAGNALQGVQACSVNSGNRNVPAQHPRHRLRSYRHRGKPPNLITRGVQGVPRVLREEGHRVILVNSNPATIMT